MSNYLIHHGILGQRKGKRNGPPYPLSYGAHSEREKKEARGAKVGQAGARWFNASIKVGKDKSNVSPAEKITKEASRAVEGAKTVTSTASKYRKVPSNNELKKIPDDELRKRVNRLSLERQYESLTSEDTKNGYDVAMDILSAVGGIVGIVGGTLAIVTTVKNLPK